MVKTGIKIALSSIAIVGGLALTFWLAKTTDLAGAIKRASSTLGSTIGESVKNVIGGSVEGFTGQPPGTASTNLTSNIAGLTDILKGKNPFENPLVQKAYGETEQMPSSQTTTQTIQTGAQLTQAENIVSAASKLNVTIPSIIPNAQLVNLGRKFAVQTAKNEIVTAQGTRIGSLSSGVGYKIAAQTGTQAVIVQYSNPKTGKISSYSVGIGTTKRL